MAEMSREEMLAMLNDMQSKVNALAAQNAELRASAAAPAKFSLKVGTKGTLCLYHGARYPIALYRGQWERLLPFFKSGKIETFIEENAADLAVLAD